MFSVTRAGCAVANKSFAHEVGHNMGCLHDRGTEGECSASATYYGYRGRTQYNGSGYRSIMVRPLRDVRVGHKKLTSSTGIQLQNQSVRQQPVQ